MLVTTLEAEIDRARRIAALHRELAVLTEDEKMFSPSVLAAVYDQIAERLAELRTRPG